MEKITHMGKEKRDKNKSGVYFTVVQSQCASLKEAKERVSLNLKMLKPSVKCIDSTFFSCFMPVLFQKLPLHLAPAERQESRES